MTVLPLGRQLRCLLSEGLARGRQRWQRRRTLHWPATATAASCEHPGHKHKRAKCTTADVDRNLMMSGGLRHCPKQDAVLTSRSGPQLRNSAFGRNERGAEAPDSRKATARRSASRTGSSRIAYLGERTMPLGISTERPKWGHCRLAWDDLQSFSRTRSSEHSNLRVLCS